MRHNDQHHPMKFVTERLKDGPVTYPINETPATFDLLEDPEYRFEEPVTGQIRLTLVGDTVVLQGHVATRARTACARCLNDIGVFLRAELTLAFMHDPALLDPARDPEQFDENTYYFDGEAIYPMEAMREVLLLELPMVAACELEPGDICPITGEKAGSRFFGPTEEKPVVEGKPGDSLADQMRRLRRQLGD
jgi:uncharacterized protein